VWPPSRSTSAGTECDGRRDDAANCGRLRSRCRMIRRCEPWLCAERVRPSWRRRRVGIHSHLRELPELIVRWGGRCISPFCAAADGQAGPGQRARRGCRRRLQPVVRGRPGDRGGGHQVHSCLRQYRRQPGRRQHPFPARLLGYRKAMELALLPDRFDAETARSLGLVNWVVTGDKLPEETAKIAQRLASGRPKPMPRRSGS